MKRALRFVKWFISKCGWFEGLMFTTAFTLSAGLAAGEGISRNIFWSIALGVNAVAILMFMIWGLKSLWKDFVKQEEQIFDILKDKDLK